MKKGDAVSVLDDDLKGTVSGFRGHLVLIEDAHGFIHEIEKENVVVYADNLYEGLSAVEKKIPQQIRLQKPAGTIPWTFISTNL